MRRHYPRFQPEHLEENLKLCKAIEVIAKRNDVTLAQVALAWVRGMSRRNGLPKIIPIPGSATEARVLENSQHVELTEEDMKDLDDILSKYEVKGDRYGGHEAALMNG
jgi:pyridoxine 4-dehydrogenase